ncbi:murein hydrolase transporter LrgA [Massilia sp. WF1]|uniref:CidA/LrgA family protein n=1 Tax=unclassified Massilia TaxID=2609279 RepID=UPI00064ACC57|nr:MULTISPECIES: CidA/LrgA family protein [unclassified Massilia]ALK97399.1 murein hydrolase transporter LrgA [Massilia sp. WG5]KLU36580.1 murein hydrolase transporter LrgA [Massilia sp. WF1]
MLQAFAVLLVFQCLGEGLVFLFGWPVPGPVTGMLLLLAALLAVPRLQEVVEVGATQLLRHLSLLFVPAGVGIVVAASSGAGQWVAIVASVVVSTLATMAVTALVLKALMPRQPKQDEEAGSV